MSGHTLSHYRLLEKIGEGGMGVVWKAEDTVLNRTVAIKVLPADLALDEERRRMFLDEARLAASVSHAHIVQVHELGREGDLDFIVMEFVEGQPLNKLLRGKPLPSEKVADWGLQVAEGLSRAHRKGLIHRDIKPSNILVTTDNEVKIVDFGLAVLFERHDSTVSLASVLTETLPEETRTRIAGTLPYMSPEQVRGEKLDARSDIFSFGTVLYEMTTGQRPFQGAKAEDLVQEILKSQPTPVHELIPKVPLDLHRTIDKTLARRREERYQIIDDAAVDLRRLYKDLESGSSQSYAELSHTQRHRLRALVTVASLVGIVAIAWISWMRYGGSGLHSTAMTYSSVAVLPLESVGINPDEGEYLADGITEALITKLTQLRNVRVTPWKTARRFKGTSSSIKDIAEEMRVDAIITGSLRKSGDQLAVTISLVDSKTGLQFWGDEIEDHLADVFSVQRRIALGAAQKLHGQLTAEQARGLVRPASHSAEAYELCLRGIAAMKQRTIEATNVAHGLFIRALALDDKLAEAHCGLADVMFKRRYLGWPESTAIEEVEAGYEQALALNPTLACAYEGLLAVYSGLGKSEECLKLGKRAAAAGVEDAENLDIRAYAYYCAGLYDRAIPLYERVLELDPANEGAPYQLGLCHLWLGRCREAADFLEARLQRFGEDARLHTFIGHANHCEGFSEEARTHYERAIELDPGEFVVYRFLGILQKQRGHEEEAQETWRHGVETLNRMLTSQSQNARMRAWLAQLHALLGHREAVQELEAKALSEEPANGVALKNLGLAYAYLGDFPRAQAVLRQAMNVGEMDFYDFESPSASGLERFCDSPEYATFRQAHSEKRARMSSRY